MAQNLRAGGMNARRMILVFASMGIRRSAAMLFGAPLLASTLLLVWPSPSQAGPSNSSRSLAPVIAADWQPPLSLPRQFRNHCSYDRDRGRIYCSNHCGIDYEFYYCSPASFGCCHAGYGYCDWKGHLRCAP